MFKKSILAMAALAALSSFASAADMRLPVKAPFLPANACMAGDCSGWYAGFGVLGDGSNVDIVANGINGSVFSTGGVLKIQGGYQFWKGSWFAALDASVGYEYTTNVSANLPVVTGRGGSKIVGTELVKLGYNFFPGGGSVFANPSQSASPIVVPANLLASSTPYFTFGGLQRRGKNEWVSGVGVQTVISAGWSTDLKYLHAPSQQGEPATSIVMLELNRHF